MRLFTPFTIPKKENCDLCRIEKNKKKIVENPLLDNLYKSLYQQRFNFVLTDLKLVDGLLLED